MQVLRNGRGLAGPPQDLVSAANGMLGTSAVQQDRWPYPWLMPRSNTQYKQIVQSIAIPAISATPTEVLEYTVPVGFRLVLRAILQTFQTGVGGAPQFVDGSGDLLWTVDVDQPIGGVALSGYGLPDLTSMAEQRGSLVNGPWALEGYTVFDQYQTLRYKITNVSSGAAGIPNYTTCGLFGWLDKALG